MNDIEYPKTRKEAKETGSKYYFTGKPCKYGHIEKRLVSKGDCIKCITQWRENNPEYGKQWRKDNPEYDEQYGKQWRENNKKYNKLRNVEYRAKNGAQHSANESKRRATKLKATPFWFEESLINKIYKKRDELNNKWDTMFHVDHIIPLISKEVCGLHCWANLQLLDATINLSKSNNYQQDW